MGYPNFDLSKGMGQLPYQTGDYCAQMLQSLEVSAAKPPETYPIADYMAELEAAANMKDELDQLLASRKKC